MKRKEAILVGAKTYIGSECKNNHNGERSTVNGECITCSSIRNQAWMLNNNDYRKVYSKNYKAENVVQTKNYLQSDAGKQVRAKAIAKRQAKGLYAYQRMIDNMRKLNRIVAWDKELTDFVGKEAHALAKIRERVVGGKWSVDHIIPIRGKVVSGLHTWNNLQVILMQQNRSKFNKLEI